MKTAKLEVGMEILIDRMAEIEADLARMTAERDTSKCREDEMRRKLLKELLKEIEGACALRARVAELEDKAERYRLTTLRQDATIAELTTDGNAATPDDSSRGVSNW